MSWEQFNQRMPHEFWSEAIQAVKRVNPNFVFIAENLLVDGRVSAEPGFRLHLQQAAYTKRSAARYTAAMPKVDEFSADAGDRFPKTQRALSGKP
jgi:hypothetical protein